MTAAATRVRQWYRDPVSCLHTTLATLLLDAGADPLQTLGLGWEFRYLADDIRPEEYYWPCRFAGDLAGSVLPYHDVSSSWQVAPHSDPLSTLEHALADGRMPIIAVDNYHLPFRPAYRDVHAAHLIVVSSVDRLHRTVGVSDAMPPAYQGVLAEADLLRSWRSANPHDDQDLFFSGQAAGARWLDVRIGDVPAALTSQVLAEAIRANIDCFRSSPGGAAVGLAGFEVFTDWAVNAARQGDRSDLAKAYTFGWSMQAQAALHGELLRTCGHRWQRPALAEAGRRVERVAHSWTAVRIHAAHGCDDPRASANRLAYHLGRLGRAYAEAVDMLAAAAAGDEARC